MPQEEQPVSSLIAPEVSQTQPAEAMTISSLRAMSSAIGDEEIRALALDSSIKPSKPSRMIARIRPPGTTPACQISPLFNLSTA
jgi:hypothetical protein